MQVECQSCDNGTASNNTPCNVCAGDGFIDLLDEKFSRQQISPAVQGIIWDAMLTSLGDIESLADDLVEQNVDILEKLVEIKTIVEA